MEKNKKDIWFPAKKYGVGWGLPVAWQRWLVLLSYVLLVLGGVLVLIPVKFPFGVVLLPMYVFLLSGILIFICRKKGEALDVRWGDKK